jgi:hypothetical protein
MACCVNPTKRREVTMMRLLITFCVGVFATLAWQAYGDTARERIAVLDPELSWLAPRAAVAETDSDTVLPASASLNQQELKTISLGFAAVGQKIDQLAANQQQIARDFTTKLQAAEQGILDKISGSPPQATAAPARKPVPSQAQAAPVR